MQDNINLNENTREVILRKFEGDKVEGDNKIPIEIIYIKYKDGIEISRKNIIDIAEIKEFENGTH